MNRRDPIINDIAIVGQRATLFVVLSAGQAAALWLYVLLGPFDVPFTDMMVWVRAAWKPEGHKLAAIIACGSVTIGVLSTSVLYLLVGRWWKKRADVHHRRGARLDDLEA